VLFQPILAAAALALAPACTAWADPGHAGHDHAVETAYGRPGDPAKGGRAIVQDDGKTPTVPPRPAEPSKLVGALARFVNN
jgi:hypothetical protein